MNKYKPSKKILEKYADVLVNFALNKGEGVKKGDTVLITVPESAKPLLFEIQKSILKAGGNFITRYLQDDDSEYNFSKMFYDNASDEQLSFAPKKYQKGLIDEVDHSMYIIAEVDQKSMKSVDSKKIMLKQNSNKYMMDLRNKKENAGNFSWTVAMYGTPEMAKEVGMSIEEYWDQIIKACYLKNSNPVQKWRDTSSKIESYKDTLDEMCIDKLHVKGKDVDLWIKLCPKRAWKGGGGANIPSFEIFTSPDWRGTNGWIKFSEPLYRYGNLIEGIELWFENGVVVKSKATKNEKLLKSMISQENADKVGEFSLTDKRFSEITKFMGETLFDENVGGKFGNTHIALGSAYKDCYKGDQSKVTAKQWEKLGYNDSVIHTDIVSTTDRTVTAFLQNGEEKVIYKNGSFTF
jgi:aminopeptidase